jgi:hypothetical protein
MGTLKKLQSYAGGRKALFPVSMVLSAVSALAGLLPYIIVWLIVKELLEAGGAMTGSGGGLERRIVPLAWWRRWALREAENDGGAARGAFLGSRRRACAGGRR